MQNNRFLKNEDYHGIITEEAFLSITRGKLSDVINAENSAEITILEHLTEILERLYWIMIDVSATLSGHM